MYAPKGYKNHTYVHKSICINTYFSDNTKLSQIWKFARRGNSPGVLKGCQNPKPKLQNSAALATPTKFPAKFPVRGQSLITISRESPANHNLSPAPQARQLDRGSSRTTTDKTNKTLKSAGAIHGL